MAAWGRNPNRCEATGRNAANGPLKVTAAIPASPPTAAAATMIRPPAASDFDTLVERAAVSRYGSNEDISCLLSLWLTRLSPSAGMQVQKRMDQANPARKC